MATILCAHVRQRGCKDRDWCSGLLTGGSFLIAMTLWNVFEPPVSLSIDALVWCVAAFVVVGCVEFEIGPACALSTVSVQVVMLFLLPPSVVPIAVVPGPGRELSDSPHAGARPEGTSNGARRFRLAGGWSGRSVRVGTRATHGRDRLARLHARAGRAARLQRRDLMGAQLLRAGRSTPATSAGAAVHVLVRRLASRRSGWRPRWASGLRPRRSCSCCRRPGRPPWDPRGHIGRSPSARRMPIRMTWPSTNALTGVAKTGSRGKKHTAVSTLRRRHWCGRRRRHALDSHERHVWPRPGDRLLVRHRRAPRVEGEAPQQRTHHRGRRS